MSNIEKGDLVEICDPIYNRIVVGVFYEWQDYPKRTFSVIPITYEKGRVRVDKDGIARNFPIFSNKLEKLGSK